VTSLSVVIPALNEQDGIADIIERVLSVREPLAEIGIPKLELIVVDDGSTDRTAEIVAGYQDVVLLQHSVNRGYGAALKTGFASATGDLLSFLDADGTYPPERFPQLCETALAGADLVIGSRMAGEASEMPLVRRLGNKIFAGMITLIGNQLVSDSASGMRVFRREILPHLYPLPDGLNFTPIMTTRAIHEKVAMAEVPIPYQERVGRSKLSVVRDGTRYVHSITWTALSYNPVRILGGASLILGGIALLVGLAIIVQRLRGVTTLGPWGVAALFVGMVSAVSSVGIFSLGAMFNYLVSLFHQRPIKQGLFGKPIFDPPLDTHFGWLGALACLGGMALGLVSCILGVRGWAVDRLWFYMVASAMGFLGGLQLLISWLVMRILEELSVRQAEANKDLGMATDG
jgi:glycosyltransferase involved in cell wall biosynthesis